MRWIAILILASVIAGCGSFEQLRDEAEKVTGKAHAVVQYANERVVTPIAEQRPLDPDIVASAQAVKPHLDDAQKSLGQLHQTVSESSDYGALVGGAGKFIRDLPVPYANWVGSGLMILAPVVTWLAGRKKGESVGKAIVKAIEAAKGDDDKVDFASPITRALLDANMGAAGKALVDKVLN